MRRRKIRGTPILFHATERPGKGTLETCPSSFVTLRMIDRNELKKIFEVAILPAEYLRAELSHDDMLNLADMFDG